MSRLTRPLALALLLSAGACASLQLAPPAERDAALRLDLALAALQAGEHGEAFEELVWVMTHCPDREAGMYARSVLVALELDPRNPTGRPDVGTRLAADLILGGGTPDWLRPLVETTYLLALGLGAPAPSATPASPGAAVDRALEPLDHASPEMGVQEGPPAAPVTVQSGPPVHGCGPPVDATLRAGAELPALPGPSLARMLATAESERDAAAARALSLDAELETLRREIAATRAELDRIRRTLRP
jgi:hypothetical protein